MRESEEGKERWRGERQGGKSKQRERGDVEEEMGMGVAEIEGGGGKEGDYVLGRGNGEGNKIYKKRKEGGRGGKI